MDTRVLNFCVCLTLLIASGSIALLSIGSAYGQETDQEQLSNEENSKPVKKKKNAFLKVAQSEDILLMVWSSRVAIESYFDACISYPPNSVEDVAKMKNKWDRSNKKVVSSLDGYMQNHLELTVNDLGEGETVESRLVQLMEKKSIKISDSISRSPEAQSQICDDLDETVGNATRDFLDLYKQNRKTIRKAYK